MTGKKLLLAAVVVAACVIPSRASAGGFLHKHKDDSTCTSCSAEAPCAEEAPCAAAPCEAVECQACAKKKGLLGHLKKDKCPKCEQPECGESKWKHCWEWLTYHPAHVCGPHCQCHQHSPCCYPPLYTFFLCCDGEGLPRLTSCDTCDTCEKKGCSRCRGH